MFANLPVKVALFSALLSPVFSVAHGAVISLTDWAFNIDSTVSEAYLGDVMPGKGARSYKV